MCDICKSAGRIIATHKKSKELYAFKCSCSSANFYASIIPEWDSRKHSGEYMPDNEYIYDSKAAKEWEFANQKPEKPEFTDEDLPF